MVKLYCVVLDDDIENISLYDVDENLNLPPLNESQKEAVEEAMMKPFTVIQGPPGIKILYNMCSLVFLLSIVQTSDCYESLNIQISKKSI